MDEQRDKDVEDGKVDEPAPRRRCSDYGKKRSRTDADAPTATRHRSKKHRSNSTVPTDSEDDLPGHADRAQPAAAGSNVEA